MFVVASRDGLLANVRKKTINSAPPSSTNVSLTSACICMSCGVPRSCARLPQLEPWVPQAHRTPRGEDLVRPNAQAMQATLAKGPSLTTPRAGRKPALADATAHPIWTTTLLCGQLRLASTKATVKRCEGVTHRRHISDPSLRICDTLPMREPAHVRDSSLSAAMARGRRDLTKHLWTPSESGDNPVDTEEIPRSPAEAAGMLAKRLPQKISLAADTGGGRGGGASMPDTLSRTPVLSSEERRRNNKIHRSTR